MDMPDGLSLSIGGAAIGSICTCLVQIWKARNQKTAIEPQPFIQEQSAYQAKMKENERDHENIFGRMSKLEQAVSRVEARLDASLTSINEQLKSQGNMILQLFERICKGGKKS